LAALCGGSPLYRSHCVKPPYSHFLPEFFAENPQSSELWRFGRCSRFLSINEGSTPKPGRLAYIQNIPVPADWVPVMSANPTYPASGSSGRNFPEPDFWGVTATCPVSAASSTGRCNTLQRVDSIILPRGTDLFDCTWSKPSQDSVPADLAIPSNLAFVFSASCVRAERCVDPLRPPR
jgi:hypothetical protein